MHIRRVGQNHIYTPNLAVYVGEFPAKRNVYTPYVWF
jgi:hypothetical protein